MSSWHIKNIEEVFEKFNSKNEGLSSGEAKERILQFGQNVLPTKKKITLLNVVLHQFLSPLIYILLVAAVVSLFLEEYSDAGFIFLVILVNAAIGTFQEWKAETKASELQEMIKIKVKVNRDNKIVVLDSEELVPGDIVHLESGNKVPADIRIIKENNLTAEEAILTGESIPISKQSEVLEKENLPVSEKFNMLFAGTTVTTGRGTGIVVLTGLDTEIGKIAASLKDLSAGKAPLVKRMEAFTKKISYIILTACFFLAGIGYLSGIPFKDIFMFAIAIAVSAIPEGLPIAMTVALSIGASRMAKRNVIIRKLTAVEGLGSCTYIATDKTGTLTVDQQTAKFIVLPGINEYNVSGEGYNGDGTITDKNNIKITYGQSTDIDEIINSVVICNEGVLEKEGESWDHAGDPIDVSFLALAYKSGVTPKKILQDIEILGEVPFESERQYSATYYKINGQEKIAVKGAIEKIKEHIDSEKYSDLIDEATNYAQNGYRIIAVGGGNINEILPDNELPNMELLGFIALIDPLRPEAKPAVELCHQAGVNVAMVTGDHPATAFSIAKDVGIAKSENELISGIELEKITSEGKISFEETLDQKRVFSRVSPQQKQIIVQSLIEKGEFVAVTGDGVNDAPALKTANIGVAMGYGTDVAKDTSSIIVSDNNFASIASGIEEGRITYSNLRKIIYLLISTGAAELIMIGLSLAFLLPLPFLPVQLLWLNLVTNGIQDVALAFEAGEDGVMKQKPRKAVERIFNPDMIKQTLTSSIAISLLTFGLWYHLLNHLNYDEAAARNTILLLMVLLQNFHAFNCRSETTSVFKIPISNNYILILGIIAAQCIHILAMHIPFMQEILSLQPIPFEDWLKLFFTASIIVIVMEVYKMYQLKKQVS